MPTQGERQNFLWRPNDNSAQTKLRYSLEAEHWVEALKGHTAKATNASTDIFGVVGLIFALIINLIFILILGVHQLIKFMFPPKKLIFEEKYPNLPKEERLLTDDEINNFIITKEVSMYDSTDNPDE